MLLPILIEVKKINYFLAIAKFQLNQFDEALSDYEKACITLFVAFARKKINFIYKYI